MSTERLSVTFPLDYEGLGPQWSHLFLSSEQCWAPKGSGTETHSQRPLSTTLESQNALTGRCMNHKDSRGNEWQVLKKIRAVQRAWTFGNRNKLDKTSRLQSWRELHRRCPHPIQHMPTVTVHWSRAAFLDQVASFRSSFVAFSWGLSLGPLRSSHHKLGNGEDLVLQSPSAHFHLSLLPGPQPALGLQYFNVLSTERVGHHLLAELPGSRGLYFLRFSLLFILSQPKQQRILF